MTWGWRARPWPSSAQHVNPISPDPAIRAAAVDNLKKGIDDAKLHRRRHSRRRHLPGAQILHRPRPDASRSGTGRADYLRTCGEYAQQAGVRLGLEFLNRFEVFLINTSAECRRMVEQVGLDNVGVHYDTHHANIEDPDPRRSTARHPGRDQSCAPE